MADEPSDEPVAHATAHECNGDREHHLACNNLSDSGASISDGATERLCQPTTIPSGGTDLGLEPAQTRAVTEALSVSADFPARAEVPLSSARISVAPITPGHDHPGGGFPRKALFQYCVSLARAARGARLAVPVARAVWLRR